MKKFKRQKALGLFDIDFRLEKLSKLNDPLEKLGKHIDFEMFRSVIEEGIEDKAKSNVGRRPYDYILLFKILILQRYYNVSDDQAEFQINDRLSFMRFLGLTIADDVPDSKTIWNFREKLVINGVIERLFNLFLESLNDLGLIVNAGKIVDATFVEVPKQRNSREENKEVKKGKIPEEWKCKPKKLAQKDTDALWTKKNNIPYYGYKNHVKVDSGSKLIEKYVVSPANMHDSVATGELLDPSDEGQEFYADSAYTGPKVEEIINKCNVVNRVCEKGSRGKALTESQKQENREKSKTRSRVEHIFGFMENSMERLYIHCIGINRTEGVIGLINLTYNMFRKVQLMAK